MSFTRDKWSKEDYAVLLRHMSSLAEEEYKRFNEKIIPDAKDAYGIRIPALRKLAKEIAKGDFRGFLAVADGDRYEEVMLTGLVMAAAKTDYDEMLAYMKRFAAMITNWAHSDTVIFDGVKKNLERFWVDSDYFITHESPWFVRYGLGHMMKYYLDGEYIAAVLQRTAAVKNDFYYVRMMQAWLYATALAKCREETIEFLKSADIDAETAKMTVGKASDSYRISAEDKALVRKILLKKHTCN